MTSYCTQCGEPLEANTTCPNDGAPAAPLSTFKPEDTIDKYTLEEMLGLGGMGEVWRARHNTIQKKVAIKFLSKKASGDQAVSLRFKREALAVNQVQHKNIVDIFDFGETEDGRPYFVMELLNGQDLSHRIFERRPMPFSEILIIVAQICRGLQAAHDKNIVHRDLKPENIFLLPDQDELRVKLLDFGIAKVSSENTRVTKANDVFGTPEYMSPEQCEGARKVDRRADLYSLAVILFEMIAGQHPFARPGDGPGTVIARQLTLLAPKLSEVIPTRQIPEALDAFIEKALSKTPEPRCASANEFLQRLTEALGALRDEITVTRRDSAQPLLEAATRRPPSQTASGDFFASQPTIAAPLPTRPTTPPSPPPKARGVLIGALCVACVLAGVFLLFSSSKTPSEPISSPQTTTLAASAPVPASAPTSEPQIKSVVVFETTPLGVGVYLQKELLCTTPCLHEFTPQEELLSLTLKRKDLLPKTIEVDISKDNKVSVALVKKNSDLILPYK